MNSTGTQSPRAWPGFHWWVGILVASYIVVSLAGWARTLLPDEIRPLILAARPPAALLELARGDLVQTPLSYFVAQGWLTVFGHSDAAAKALALVIGAATIVVFAFLARRTTTHWRLAALLCCLVYLRVGTSPNLVRMYGLLVLLATASMLAWDVWRHDPRLSKWLVWAGLSVAAVYTHPSALLLVGATAIATGVAGPRRVAFMAAATIPMLAILPWVGFVLPVYQDRGIEANVGALADDPIRETARLPFYFLTGDPPGGGSPLETRYMQGDWSLLRRAALAVAAAFGLVALRGVLTRKPFVSLARDDDVRLVSNFLLVAVPAAVLLLVSVVSQPVMSARYLLVSLPAMLLLIAQLTAISGRPGRVMAAVVTVWVLVSAGYSLKLNLAPAFARESSRYLDTHLEQNDIIIAAHHWAIGWEYYWEWTRRLGRTEPVNILPGEQPEWLRDILPARDLDSLSLDTVQRIWLLSLRRVLTEDVTAELAGRGFERVESPDSAVRNMQFLMLFVRTPGEPGSTGGHAESAAPVLTDSTYQTE